MQAPQASATAGTATVMTASIAVRNLAIAPDPSLRFRWRLRRPPGWRSGQRLIGRKRGTRGCRLRLLLPLRPQVGIGPLEVRDELARLLLREILVRHGQLVLVEESLRVGIGLQHLLRRLEPAAEPGIIAPLGHAVEVRPQLVAAGDRVAREAFR